MEEVISSSLVEKKNVTILLLLVDLQKTIAQAGLRDEFEELEARLHVVINERDRRLASRVIDDETHKLAARVFGESTTCFSEKEKLYARHMELNRARVVELEGELADATSGWNEQKIYSKQLKETLERRSED